MTTALSSKRGWKFAIIVDASLTVTVKGLSRLVLPVQLMNSYPASAVAMRVTLSPVVLKEDPRLSTVPPDEEPTLSNDCPSIGKIEIPRLSKSATASVSLILASDILKAADSPSASTISVIDSGLMS